MCCPASPPFDLDSLWLAQIPSWLFLPCINSKCVLVIKANFSLPSTLWSEKAAVNRCAPYDSSLLAFCSLKVNGQGCTFGKLGLQHSPEIFVQGGGLRGCGEGVDGLWSGMVTLYRENDAFWKKKKWATGSPQPWEVAGLWLFSSPHPVLSSYCLSLAGDREFLRGLVVIIWCPFMLHLQFI